jgi:hypothetical protein
VPAYDWKNTIRIPHTTIITGMISGSGVESRHGNHETGACWSGSTANGYRETCRRSEGADRQIIGVVPSRQPYHWLVTWQVVAETVRR